MTSKRSIAWFLLGVCSSVYPAQIPEAFCLQQIILHEARGEGKQGMLAVGSVVLNRVKSKDYPSSICAVVLQPKQFSGFRLNRTFSKASRRALELAEKIAKGLLAGEVKKSLPAGFMWFARAGTQKTWMQGMETRQIGKHVFYRKSLDKK